MTEKSEKTEMGMNEWVVYDVSSWNAAVFFFFHDWKLLYEKWTKNPTQEDKIGSTSLNLLKTGVINSD